MATGYGDGGNRPQNEELELVGTDERLPWLESGDDDDDTRGGFDNSRLMTMGALALLLLLVVVGGIWYVKQNGTGTGPAADGSVIAAPEEPYKQRPENDGGKTFQGTGDTSFAVGEGQTREGRLAERPVTDTAPKPSIATTLDGPDTAAAKPAAPAASQGGVGVQVGAYSKREQAEEGWATLIRQTDALSGVRHRIVEGQADIGRVYRLQAVAGDRASANRLCAALKEDGLNCQVK